MREKAINVLLLTGRIGTKGLSSLVVPMAGAIRKRGLGVHVLCKGLAEGLAPGEPGTPVHTWADVLRVAPFTLFGRLVTRIMEETGANIVHVLGLDIGSAGLRFLRQCPVPFVLSVIPPVQHKGLLARLQRRSARVLASSEEVREDLVNLAKCPKDKVSVLPPGVDVGSFPPRLPGHSERAALVGVAGPLTRRSGFELFLEAAGLVHQSSPDVRFVVAGEGREEKKLRAKAESLAISEHVCFIQRLTSYRQVIETMDIFVEPSLEETFPGTMLEAMAFGKAVVASGVGGVYPFISDGRTGRVCRKEDPAALAAAIADLVRDPDLARGLGHRARKHLREHFNLEDAMEKVTRIYREILAERKVPAGA